MYILNDLHLGVNRKAGTTPASQAALREHSFGWFKVLLTDTTSDTLVINGDLFDGFDVDGADLILAFEMLNDWLWVTAHRKLVLVAGNHDWSPKAGRTSAFHLLAHFLQATRLSQVKVIDHTCGLTRAHGRTWAIAHMPNQDQFDLELERAKVERGDFLLLHANYANKFATESDHSLNVSEEQAKALVDRGWTLVFGHEHPYREALGGKVVMVGCQIVTSVSDCIGVKTKYAASLTDKVELLPVLEVSDIYAEIDWRDVAEAPDMKFLRVTGTATAEEADDAVSAVAKLRQSSDALVISNAVKVDGLAEFDKLAEMTFENVTAFNVLDALLAELSEDEGKVVEELLG